MKRSGVGDLARCIMPRDWFRAGEPRHAGGFARRLGACRPSGGDPRRGGRPHDCL